MVRTSERSPLVPLPPMRLEQARRLLSPPWVPTMLAPSIARAHRARALAVPVRLVLPQATLGPRFARALHALTGGHGSLLVASDERPALFALPLGATVVVDPTRLDDEALAAMDALCDDGDVWLVAVMERDASVPPMLASRLDAVVVDVPPLARRQLELPALSAAVLQTLASRAGRPTPALSPAARTRLAAHAWPGDVFELEALLARAMTGRDAATIDVVDLGLGGDAGDETPAADAAADDDAVSAARVDAADRAPTPASTTPVVADRPAPPADGRLESLLAEVAHEILNPLSTVKMLLGHLPQLLADDETRRTMTERADEAIERVDGLLQNVLAFARLGDAVRTRVAVAPLLDRCLREAAPELAERALRVRRTGDDDVVCVGDAAQLEYGFRNLLAGVVRELPPREEFVVDARQNGVVAVQFVAGDVAASRLRAMVAQDGPPDLGDPTMLPLSFTIARAVLQRNGGSLDVREEPDGPTTLVVRLPVTETQ
jgi:signal transduction histidine kinase